MIVSFLSMTLSRKLWIDISNNLGLTLHDRYITFQGKSTAGIPTKGAKSTTPFKAPTTPAGKKSSPYIAPPIDTSESGESVDDPVDPITTSGGKRRLGCLDNVRSTKGKTARTMEKIAASDCLFYEERGAALQYEATKDLTAEDLAKDVKLTTLSKAEIAKMTNEERQAQILIKLRKLPLK